MAIRILGDNESDRLSSEGLLDVKLVSPSGLDSVELVIEGDCTYNVVSPTHIKLVRGQGLLHIVARPRTAGTSREFASGTQVETHIGRGYGTGHAEGFEFKPLSLNGRAATVLGTLDFRGDAVVVTSATIEASNILRPQAAAINAAAVRIIRDFGLNNQPLAQSRIPVIVDVSASMRVTLSEEQIHEAADIIIGLARSFDDDAAIEVRSSAGGSPLVISDDEQLASAMRAQIFSGNGDIGGQQLTSSVAPGEVAFALTDDVMLAAVDRGIIISSGLSPAPSPGVIELSPQLHEAMLRDDPLALDPIVRRGLTPLLSARTETAPSVFPQF